MPLEAGTRLGPYEILSAVGAGGMGEVYRARDTRLDRIVAVKVLPSHLARSEALRLRLEREARAVSSLNHPHICTLYDVGREGESSYLIMEFLEGETLAARLQRGAMPAQEVLRIGLQLTDALDRAHRQGVIHRDLKPGNVMLTKAGAKLLDFGLAKGADAGQSTSTLTASPTVTTPLTAEGTIVGTFQYMSPEQLEGKPADARSDIFALGSVLYEMATGRKAFEGRSHASLIAAIMDRDPAPISSLQPLSPPALDRVVSTCLAKDPDDRWQTAHDLALQLRWTAEAGSTVGAPVPVTIARKGRERIWITACVLLLAAVIALGAALFLRPAPPVRTIRSQIGPPEDGSFVSVGPTAGPLVISPDGRYLVFAATSSKGTQQLWLRPLDEMNPRPLPGTENGGRPFWSPDSRLVGFFADGKLKKVEIAGGPALSICDAPDPRGGTWSRQGVILFEPDSGGPLFRVPAAGGTPAQVTDLDKTVPEDTHRYPEFLPDGQGYIYLARAVTSGSSQPATALYAGALGAKERKLLVRGTSNAVYASRHLLFARESTLMAQAFDPSTRELMGDAFPIAEMVQHDVLFNRANFSASENGILAYQLGAARLDSQLVWYERDGKRAGLLGDPASSSTPRISRDGSKVGVSVVDAQSGNWDIWFEELSRPVRTRFTFDPAVDALPLWSPDQTRVVFSSNRKGPFDLYEKAATGIGEDQLLYGSSGDKFASDWAADGKHVVFSESDPNSKTKENLWVLPMTGDRRPTLYLQTPFSESAGAFSPDGRYLVYQSDESGRNEIYVSPFPAANAKWQVSTGGGVEPRWPGGREIFFLAPDNQIMSAEVSVAAGVIEVSAVRPLFKIDPSRQLGYRYDVTADGRRFLVNTAVDQSGAAPIALVVNWLEGVKK